MGIYCHHIPTDTPQGWYHVVIGVTKTANIAKMAEKGINCMSPRPTPPHTNPMESGPGNTFSAQNRKKPKDCCFSAKKGGVIPFDPPPPPPPKAQKSGFQVGGFGGGRSGPETHRGMRLVDKIMILQEVKQTIQPLGVGYANRLKKAQNGRMWRLPLYTLAWLDLTTSAR